MKFKNYCKAIYDDDLKLTYFVLNKYCSKVHFDDFEQVVNDCLFRLYRCHIEFNNARGSFSTFAVCSLLSVIGMALRRPRETAISLDDKFDDDTTLSDYIGTEDNYDEIGVYDVIERVLKHYKEKECQIIRLYIRGYKMPEIAKAFLCTKQNICKIINKFRKDLRAELKKVGYEI